MSKQRRKLKVEALEFELPELLRKAQESAMVKLRPSSDEVDNTPLPNLLAFLTPFALPDPRHKGEGEPKTVLRETMALISFDRRAGQWKVTLSDKMLALGGSITVQSLATALSDCEVLLANGAFPWSSKEDS